MTNKEKYDGWLKMAPFDVFELHEKMCKDGVPHKLVLWLDGEVYNFEMKRPEYFVELNNDL